MWLVEVNRKLSQLIYDYLIYHSNKQDIIGYTKSLFNPKLDGIPCNPMYTLKDDPILSPQMFLYSREDLLIPFTVSNFLL